MNFTPLAERTRYLKENPEGVSEMCQILEEMRNESMEEGRKAGIRETARRMLLTGKYSLEEITAVSGIPAEELRQIKMKLHR